MTGFTFGFPNTHLGYTCYYWIFCNINFTYIIFHAYLLENYLKIVI